MGGCLFTADEVASSCHYYFMVHQTLNSPVDGKKIKSPLSADQDPRRVPPFTLDFPKISPICVVEATTTGVPSSNCSGTIDLACGKTSSRNTAKEVVVCTEVRASTAHFSTLMACFTWSPRARRCCSMVFPSIFPPLVFFRRFGFLGGRKLRHVVVSCSHHLALADAKKLVHMQCMIEMQLLYLGSISAQCHDL